MKDGRTVGSAEDIARVAASGGGVGERVDPVNNVRREVSMCTRVFGFGRPSNMANCANIGTKQSPAIDMA